MKVIHKNYNYTVSDPGDDTIIVNNVSCGENGNVANQTFNGVDGSFTCNFPEGPAVSTVSVEVSDDDTSSSTELLVHINNLAPEVSNINVSSDLIIVGENFSASASFSDPGTLDTHVAQLDWDDGTTDNVDPATSPLTINKSYAASGDYDIELTVTDDDGGSDSSILPVHIFSPAEVIGLMEDCIDEAGLANGSANALKVSLDNALKKINNNQNHVAINNLEAFINKVLSDNEITTEDSEKLIDLAERTIQALLLD